MAYKMTMIQNARNFLISSPSAHNIIGKASRCSLHGCAQVPVNLYESRGSRTWNPFPGLYLLRTFYPVSVFYNMPHTSPRKRPFCTSLLASQPVAHQNRLKFIIHNTVIAISHVPTTPWRNTERNLSRTLLKEGNVPSFTWEATNFFRNFESSCAMVCRVFKVLGFVCNHYGVPY